MATEGNKWSATAGIAGNDVSKAIDEYCKKQTGI